MTMKFQTFQYADISTGYLPESDYALLSDEDLPCHIAREDEGRGDFFWVPEDDEAFSSDMSKCREIGLSERFVEVMAELKSQGILYVRFDADGGDVEGLSRLDEEVL